MAEARITFPNHDEIRTLFGARDRYLNRVRDEVGIDVVVRGDELRLHGDDERVDEAVRVIRSLRESIQLTGSLTDDDVERALGTPVVAAEVTEPKPTEPTLRIPTTLAPAVVDEEPAIETATSIDVFERARKIRPRTKGQERYVEAMQGNDLVFCRGPAGCGKTYLAVAMAVNAFRTESVRKIVLVRPAVEAGERLGFLPGDMLQKVNPYLRPLLDALNDILDYEQVKTYMEKDIVEIVPLAFMRGRTLNNTFMILDEAQNTTVTQMKMFLTRMGAGSKIVVTGDTTQVDLPTHVTSGLADASRRLSGIRGTAVVELDGRDIVRHRLVREIVAAYEATEKRSGRRSPAGN